MKVAIYCRLSEEDKHKECGISESESIQNQKSMLLHYSFEQGWEIYNIYSDDDYAGSDRKRPAFNRLLKDAEQHKFDIVLCKTQSRFTRELELVEKYIHGLFPNWGIRFISIVDNADTANRGNKKARQINGLVNEWYLEDMSENIKSVLTDKRRKGVHIGSFALYGYKKDPDKKGHLLIDEEAASIVREVFNLFSQGYGKTAIARILNERKIPTPAEYKRLHGLRYQTSGLQTRSLWSYSTISNMLQNEIYIGNMVQGKYGSISYKTKQNKPRPREEWYRVEGTHEPVVDRILWDRVQSLLKQRTKPFSSGMTGLFAGKAKCAGCGHIMRSAKSHNRHYLQCPCRHLAKNACSGSFLSVDALEQTILSELNRLAKIYLDVDQLKKCTKNNTDLLRERKKWETELSFYQKKKEECILALQESYLDKVRGVLTEKDYLIFSRNFSVEQNRLDSVISDIQTKVHTLTAFLDKEKCQEHQNWQLLPILHLNREMVDGLIEFILVSKRIPGTATVPIEIHWNF